LFGSSKNSFSGYSRVTINIDPNYSYKIANDSLIELGFETFSYAEEFEEIRQIFLYFNMVLGLVGFIALITASLGIVNTMIMSIMERTREIGIMKAIGGSEWEIRKIFFVEASAIGLVGAIFGLILGWMVSRVANYVVNTSILLAGEEAVNLFYFPMWLVLGAIAFSIFVSLGAGLYPANRAARINPVEALRHD